MGVLTRTGLLRREMRELSFLRPGQHHVWPGMLGLSVQAPPGLSHGYSLGKDFVKEVGAHSEAPRGALLKMRLCIAGCMPHQRAHLNARLLVTSLQFLFQAVTVPSRKGFLLG